VITIGLAHNILAMETDDLSQEASQRI